MAFLDFYSGVFIHLLVVAWTTDTDTPTRELWTLKFYVFINIWIKKTEMEQ